MIIVIIIIIIIVLLIVVPAILFRQILIASEIATTALGSFQVGPLSSSNWKFEINDGF